MTYKQEAEKILRKMQVETIKCTREAEFDDTGTAVFLVRDAWEARKTEALDALLELTRGLIGHSEGTFDSQERDAWRRELRKQLDDGAEMLKELDRE